MFSLCTPLYSNRTLAKATMRAMAIAMMIRLWSETESVGTSHVDTLPDFHSVSLLVCSSF